jgi:AcrR family transcriptional regulator
VLEAAVALLLEGGLSAVTVEAVVERSGVARSTIYRHWATRRDLVLATFLHLTPPHADPDVEGSLRERLLTLLEAHVERLAVTPWAAAIPTLLDATSRDPELAEVRLRLADLHRGPFRRTLRQAIEQGDLPADTDVDEAITQLAGPVFFRRLITTDPVDRHFAHRVVDLFLASRRPPR